MGSAPRATYRVQLSAGFGFDAAAALAGYLSELGVSHLYCSPVLQAAPGSTHGYDVVDHSRLSDQLGGPEGFARLAEALRSRSIGLVLDVVPNHMATAGRANAWWWDVLEDGPASLYASYFDIDWDPPEARLRQKVLVPVLGDRYGRVLERGELHVGRRGGQLVVSYFEHELPVSPRTLDEVLADAAEVAEDPADRSRLVELGREMGQLPHASHTDRATVERRHRRKQELAARLEELCRARPPAAAAVERALEGLNRDSERLDQFLARQNYRLAYWRVAAHELDYRRFFDIPGLIALRVEDPRVFGETHDLVGRLVRDATVDGLRIDHLDGLRDPATYLERLVSLTGGAWVVVEKILEGREALRAGWQTAGTTGYEFLNLVTALLVDPAGELPLTDLYRSYTMDHSSFEETAVLAKREMMVSSLATDVERLTALLAEACELRPRFRDHTRRELRDCLREVLASLAVYRTYVTPWAPPAPQDLTEIDAACRGAAARRPDLDPDLLGLLGELLAGRSRAPVEVELAMRFQQLSGPVMAKGVEDTASYRYNRLLCLNEVGGAPDRFGASPEELHAHNRRIQRDWPQTMTTTSTHDTKRSEDVRARLALLSEIPQEWAAAVGRWRELADRHRSKGRPQPRSDYVLFQTMVGAHPVGVERLQAFMLKASREAKLDTSWTDPDAGFEEALEAMVAGLVQDRDMQEELEAFVAPLVLPGRVNALVQVALKLTSPGVPDIYQGNESWDLSLVDPDNRRPVDHQTLARLLDQAGRPRTPPEVGGSATDLSKLWLTRRLLRLRAERPDLLGPAAEYEPLWPAGPRARHAVAFRRGEGLITVVPRLVLGLQRAGGWGDTVIGLPSGRWQDHLSATSWSGAVPLAHLLGSFPVSVLVKA